MKTMLDFKKTRTLAFLAICLLVAFMVADEPFAQSRRSVPPGQASGQNLPEAKTGPAVRGKSPERPSFQRPFGVRILMSRKQIENELSDLSGRALLLLSTSFWIDKLGRLWMSEGGLLLTGILLFGLLLMLLVRVRRFLHRYRAHMFFNRRPFLRFAFDLFRQGIPLFGIMLFFHAYSQFQLADSVAAAIELVVDILWVWLISRWYLDFVSSSEQKELFPDSNQILTGLRAPIIWTRFFVVAHLVLARILDYDSAILLLGRIVFEALFLIWYFRFSRRFRTGAAPSVVRAHRRRSMFKALGGLSGYIVVGGGLVLDLMGYGHASVYWLGSWAQTAAVALWGGLFFLVLREWYLGLQQTSKSVDDVSQGGGNPFRWLFVWIAWLVWLIALLVSVIWAWGGRQALVLSFLKAFNTPFKVGSMQLSVMGFIYGFLIVLITHAAVRFWRHFFHKKVLGRSDLEVGLQESITTLAVYVFWGIGIIIALHAVGLNTATMAVGLGALGIGLGFGLQNIFNNFISGLILLFERPIQVGDAVEINGVWAYVKKINVRATVVQTWDNASLIIPNSEFVSSQVTNWSFKDLRLRRNIIAGVAYGSDVELVKKTLLEIAADHPRVLKEPGPDVLFSDFGDSALIFKLRVWTYVEGMLTVESDLRFEIDRRFRLNHITIAFPQRDIHIRSTAEPVQTGDKSDR